MRNQEKRRGCIIGGAIGDAFGYEIEFKNIASIKRSYGDSGLQEPVLHDGKLIVSDDTQMTLFTLEAVNDCEAMTSTEDVVGRIREAYLDWFNTQREKPLAEFATGVIWKKTMLQKMRAPGNCCMTSLAAGGPGTPETPINDNKGCGGVMRIAPIGLFPEKWDANQAFELAMRAAAITHTHPTGFLSSGVLAAIIRYLFDGFDLKEAINLSCGILKGYRDHEETLVKVDQALTLANQTIEPLEAVETLGQGWIAEEALGIGLFAVLKGSDFKEVIQIAANHSGDSDSTASIAGQIYGAIYGMEDIPEKWHKALDVYDVIEELL